MPWIRMVKPELFTHEGLYDLEQESGLPVRLVFIGLWTQADRAGLFPWRPRMLQAAILPFDTKVQIGPVLEALARGGFLLPYSNQGKLYGEIPSWRKHQWINGKERVSLLPPPGDPGSAYVPLDSLGKFLVDYLVVPRNSLEKGSLHASSEFTSRVNQIPRGKVKESKVTERKPSASQQAAQRGEARFALTVEAIHEACKRHGVGFEWNDSEGKQLSQWLKGNTFTMAEIGRLIENRFLSHDGPPGARPRTWIQNLGKYTTVLDRFGRPEGAEGDERLGWEERLIKRNNEIAERAIERAREEAMAAKAAPATGELFPDEH